MNYDKNVVFFLLNAYSVFNPLNNNASIGGSEVDVYNTAVFLKNNGYKITVLVGDFGQKNIEYYNGIKVVKTIKSKNNGFIGGIINGLKLFFYLYKSKGDIYIFKCASHYLGLGVIFGKFFGKKIIFRTAHDIDCNGDFIKNNGILGKIYKYGLLNSDFIITQNRENSLMLSKKYGINSSFIGNIYDIKKEKITSFERRSYILWISRCEKWKRPEIFLDVVEKNRKKKFLMICPRSKGKDTYYSEIKKRAECYRNLKFIEKVPFKKVQEYYNSAICFIGTSDYEGFPNTYIQSCLGGTPIISLNVNPNNFIIKNNIGFFCNGDVNCLSNRLKIIEQKDIWHKLSNNTINYVVKNHSYDHEGKKYLVLLDNIK
ncbi:MAG: glycosyltransferase family 4 protein [Candidatus Absconditabacterales bacterium]